MHVFKSPIKNSTYFIYRLLSPVIDPIRFVYGIYGYLWFLRDLFLYLVKDRKTKIKLVDLFPQLHDKTNFTHLDAHYFYQQLWVFEKVLKNRPLSHTDIASTYQMSGYLSKITPTTFIDYRPIQTNLKNLDVFKGDILSLDFKDDSLESISCLHVIEHIGLGRYGDSLDPNGSMKACKELQRVLKQGGKLYLSLPVGKEKICFNAHRIHNPATILKYFDKLKLVSYSVVDDGGDYYENADLNLSKKLNYGCGMFEFTK